jgi:hypothetical protein
MIKKQQKWIALLVVCTFIWLMQVSTMPVAAAGTTEQISSASAEQGPDYYESVSNKAAPAKKKSPLPFILIGVGLLTVTAVVLILVVMKNYNIVGNWNFNLVSITYPGDTFSWTMTFYGSKKSGTFMDSDGEGGTYAISGKNITNIRYDNISLSFTGKFDGKDKISGSYTWTYYDEVGTWTGNRGGAATMPGSLSKFREKKNREILSR